MPPTWRDRRTANRMQAITFPSFGLCAVFEESLIPNFVDFSEMTKRPLLINSQSTSLVLCKLLFQARLSTVG